MYHLPLLEIFTSFIKSRYSTICDVKNVNESPVIAKAGISFKGQADLTSLMYVPLRGAGAMKNVRKENGQIL